MDGWGVTQLLLQALKQWDSVLLDIVRLSRGIVLLCSSRELTSLRVSRYDLLGGKIRLLLSA